MFHIHKWQVLAENSHWKFERCSKCGAERWNENYLAPYQPKPIIPEIRIKALENEVAVLREEIAKLQEAHNIAIMVESKKISKSILSRIDQELSRKREFII